MASRVAVVRSVGLAGHRLPALGQGLVPVRRLFVVARLVGRYRAAIHRPIGELSSAELHTLLTQGTDPHFLAPVALERLRGPLGLDERALLGDVLRLPREFWRLRPFLEAELRELAAAILATLGEDADEPSALARELTRLLERA